MPHSQRVLTNFLSGHQGMDTTPVLMTDNRFAVTYLIIGGGGVLQDKNKNKKYLFKVGYKF